MKFLIKKETSDFVKCLFCKNFIWLMIVASPEHFTSDMGQAQITNDTPSPPSDIRKEICPEYEVSFMTKYYLNYWKLSIIKNHTPTWKPEWYQMKETLKSATSSPEKFFKNCFPLIAKRGPEDDVLKSTEYWLQKLPWSNIYNKNGFLRQHLSWD